MYAKTKLMSTVASATMFLGLAVHAILVSPLCAGAAGGACIVVGT